MNLGSGLSHLSIERSDMPCHFCHFLGALEMPWYDNLEIALKRLSGLGFPKVLARDGQPEKSRLLESAFFCVGLGLEPLHAGKASK